MIPAALAYYDHHRRRRYYYYYLTEILFESKLYRYDFACGLLMEFDTPSTLAKA